MKLHQKVVVFRVQYRAYARRYLPHIANRIRCITLMCEFNVRPFH